MRLHRLVKLMIVIASVRPGRAGLPVSAWVHDEAQKTGAFDEIDVADLAEIALPFMDEPNHPSLRQYTQPHTIAWSERVDAADAVVFVAPEYNHSYAPSLKNAFDFLNQEWWRKPVGFVSYGGVSAGTRGVTAFEPVLGTVGAFKVTANVEIPFVGTRLADGAFAGTEKETAILQKQFAELAELSAALAAPRA